MPGRLSTKLIIWSVAAVAGAFTIDLVLNYLGWANTPGAAMEAVFSAGLLLLLFYLAKKLVIKPLESVEAAAEKIKTGDLTVRVHETSSREMTVLSDTLNSMMDRLAESYEQMRAANAALEGTVVERTRELSVERDKLQAMLMSMPDGVIFIGISGEIKEINPMFGEIWGVRPEEVIGGTVDGLPEGPLKDSLTFRGTSAPTKRCWEMFDCVEKNCPAYMSDDIRCWLVSGTYCRKGVQVSVKRKREDICSQCVVFKEVMGKCSDSREIEVGGRHYKVGGALVLDKGQKVLGEIKTFYDFTAEKLLERRKADFVSLITHDLKSPLSSILGYTDLLIGGGTGLSSTESQEYLRSIKNSGRRLLDLVEQYLELTRIEAGMMAINKGPVRPEEIIDEAISDLGALAMAKNIKLSCEFPAGLPAFEADRPKMLRVATNLVSNAIKFTPEGGAVKVSACESDDGRGGRVIEIEVTDTGRGISEGDLPHIFDPYYRSERDSDVKGTGLGLAVVKSIVEAHGGYVMVESIPGEGSVFKIGLPVTR